MRSILIRDTTREEREQIVRQGLAACGSSCEGCNGCDNLYIECCTCLIIRNKIDMSIVTLLEAPNHLCTCY